MYYAVIQEKFPDACDEHINSMIGGFFFLRYVNPTIATPHGTASHLVY